MAAMRYIISFTASRPFLMGGMQWLKLRVLGQSFLLHHIRKMVAVTVEVVRGRLSKADVNRAFGQEKVTTHSCCPPLTL